MKSIFLIITLTLSFGFANAQKTNYELLQGKWQSTEDKTNFLIFEKNKRKEIAEGMDSWDIEDFVLANSCQNSSDKANGIPPEKNKYISVAKSDLCWYIVKINSTTLGLSYMGRGNTLSYKRVKTQNKKPK